MNKERTIEVYIGSNGVGRTTAIKNRIENEKKNYKFIVCMGVHSELSTFNEEKQPYQEGNVLYVNNPKEVFYVTRMLSYIGARTKDILVVLDDVEIHSTKASGIHEFIRKYENLIISVSHFIEKQVTNVVPHWDGLREVENEHNVYFPTHIESTEKSTLKERINKKLNTYATEDFNLKVFTFEKVCEAKEL